MGFSSSHEFITEATPRLQPCQIVCLEHETNYLYAEVIQVIESRQLCWARPLILVLQPAALTCDSPESVICYDLRQDSDLLLPLTLFRPALDTEVCTWATNLYANDHHPEVPTAQRNEGHRPFRQFIQQIWQAHPDVFQSLSTSNKMPAE
ncbi:MAG: hypothetical protein ACAF41_31905 [Leptolyngbya sp. BL-A-14]